MRNRQRRLRPALFFSALTQIPESQPVPRSSHLTDGSMHVEASPTSIFQEIPMPTLLHLDVSPRGDYSVSRHLSKAVAEEWKKNNPGGKVIYRDLSHKPLPFVDLPW